MYLNPILRSLYRAGASLEIVKITGDPCPCMTSRNPGLPEYSADWHRAHPSSADCQGKGKINQTAASIPVKAIVFPAAIANSPNGQADPAVQAAIGKIVDADMILIGTVRHTDQTFFDLRQLSEASDRAVFGGVSFKINNVFDVITNETKCQVAGLKRV